MGNTLNTESSLSRQRADGSRWSKRGTSSVTTLPDNTTLSERLFLRGRQFAEETISIHNALYMFDGIYNTEEYNALIDGINADMAEMERRYKIPSYTLVIVENGRIIKAMNITAKSVLDEIVKQLFNCTPEDIMLERHEKYPKQYRGTAITKQEWIDNIAETINIIKQGT